MIFIFNGNPFAPGDDNNPNQPDSDMTSQQRSTVALNLIGNDPIMATDYIKSIMEKAMTLRCDPVAAPIVIRHCIEILKEKVSPTFKKPGKDPRLVALDEAALACAEAFAAFLDSLAAFTECELPPEKKK